MVDIFAKEEKRKAPEIEEVGEIEETEKIEDMVVTEGFDDLVEDIKESEMLDKKKKKKQY